MGDGARGHGGDGRGGPSYGFYKASAPEPEQPVAVVDAAEDYFKVDRFENHGLSEDLLRGLKAAGIDWPGAFQLRGIKPILDGRNVIGEAPVGSGKTAAFIIGTLQRLDIALRACQVLILAPTGEAALNISKVVLDIGRCMEVSCHTCVGRGCGALLGGADERFEGQHVVVGTAGRVLDAVRRGLLRLDDLFALALDEAGDILCTRGAEEDLRGIFDVIPPRTQVCLFTARVTPAVSDLTDKSMRDVVRIAVGQDRPSTEGIRQYYLAVEREDWKLETMFDLHETIPMTVAIVNCNTIRKVCFLVSAMNNQGISAAAIHAGLAWKEREAVVHQWRVGSVRTLVTNGLHGLHIDIPSCSLVINYDLPEKADYLHRICIGRGLRRRCTVITFVTNADARAMKDIEEHFNIQMEELPLNIADLL